MAERRIDGTLYLGHFVQPQLVVLEERSDSKSEINLADVPAEELLLKEADRWSLMVRHEDPQREIAGLRAACLNNNIGAGWIEREVPYRATVFLEGADICLGQSVYPSGRYDDPTIEVLASVVRATIAFNYAVAHRHMGNEDKCQAVRSVASKWLLTVSRSRIKFNGTELEDRVSVVRAAVFWLGSY